MCEKFDVTFGRWDNLQHHVRSICNGSSSSRSSSGGSSRCRGHRLTTLDTTVLEVPLKNIPTLSRLTSVTGWF